MEKILIATGNPGKFTEIMEIFRDLPCEFLSLRDVDFEGGVEEDGETFEENAFKKAKFFAEQVGLPVIAEDSGIIVDALPGELGVKTRRWGKGEKASDEEWIEYFLERMSVFEVEEKKARFVCCSVFLWKGEKKVFQASTEGILTATLEAPIKPGLPLSSCFKPEGCDKVYAALSEKKKNKLSHRGKALKNLKAYLSVLL